MKSWQTPKVKKIGLSFGNDYSNQVCKSGKTAGSGCSNGTTALYEECKYGANAAEDCFGGSAAGLNGSCGDGGLPGFIEDPPNQ